MDGTNSDYQTTKYYILFRRSTHSEKYRGMFVCYFLHCRFFPDICVGFKLNLYLIGRPVLSGSTKKQTKKKSK